MVETKSTELLIVKDGERYIRFFDNGFEYCSMNKASVYPLETLAEVKDRCQQIESESGELKLMKLIITEEPFIE